MSNNTQPADNNNLVVVKVEKEERKAILNGIARAANRGGDTLIKYLDVIAPQLKTLAEVDA